jgi:hypothetical protein
MNTIDLRRHLMHLCLEVQGQFIRKLLGRCGQSHAYQEWRTTDGGRGPNHRYRISEDLAKVAQDNHSPSRGTVNAVRNRWYATLSKREQALSYDMEQMLSIHERMRNQKPTLELRGEERAV